MKSITEMFNFTEDQKTDTETYRCYRQSDEMRWNSLTMVNIMVHYIIGHRFIV